MSRFTICSVDPKHAISHQRLRAPGPSSSLSLDTPPRYFNPSIGSASLRDFALEGPRSRERTQGNKGKGVRNLIRNEREFRHTTGFPEHHVSSKMNKKRKKLAVKNVVQKDVYIPKNITVANLARLLGVKHSERQCIFSLGALSKLFIQEHLQQTMESNVMTNTNSDYSMFSRSIPRLYSRNLLQCSLRLMRIYLQLSSTATQS